MPCPFAISDCVHEYIASVFFFFLQNVLSLSFREGDPLYVGMDITIASFDAISEVNMVSKFVLIPPFHSETLRRTWQELQRSFRSNCLLSLSPIGAQDYTLTLCLNQYWRDDRLAFTHEKDVVLTLSGDFSNKIWV